MKNIVKLVLPVLLCGIFAFATVANASALTLREGAEAAQCDGCPSNLFGDTGVFKQITNTVLYIVGIIAVIMLIIGGIKYVVSGGDSKKVTDAKNTVLYAIIGLIISFLAFAIVNFVITALPSSETTEETACSLIRSA
ncbi:MAG: pilin [Candidatus Saccharibacteria bacterium]|nr:pilin [Candidatus Saccharibacteria bacterium]